MWSRDFGITDAGSVGFNVEVIDLGLHRAAARVRAQPGEVLEVLEPRCRELCGDAIELRIHRADDDAVVDLPGSSVKRVVLNLVENAIAAMPEGGQLELSTEVRHGVPGPGPSTWLRLAVADDGEGMEPWVFDRAFFPGFTTASCVRRMRGFGLSDCARLVSEVGGRIEVTSEPGRGSRFDVWLPARA